MPARVVALKCDGCIERTTAGRLPACVEACKTGGLVYGELNELIAEGRAQEASVVLTSAAAGESLSARPPENVTGWRTWGATATELNEGVHHGRH
jgi:carbon-monoxide dehydrogenase iron sulfur subunit